MHSPASPDRAPTGLAEAISGLSSMATAALLAERVAAWRQQGGPQVHIESVGGVDAARRVRAGERFDLVVLAADAIDRLIADGCLQAGSRVDLVRSPMAVAVRAGAPRPDIATPAALRQAVQAAPRVGCSTGPSGVHLTRLLQQWGLADRLVQAPPGVPVARLVAQGEVQLGFQQLAELLHAEGIEVLGEMPAGLAFVTTFAAALGLASPRAAAVRQLLAFINSPASDAAKRQQGMEPAGPGEPP